jgi:hypothetical protein
MKGWSTLITVEIDGKPHMYRRPEPPFYPTKATVEEKLTHLKRLSPDKHQAVAALVDDVLRHEWPQEPWHPSGPGSLIQRLEAAHSCSDTPQFHQLPKANGRRRWRCVSCGEIVTLEGGA